MHAAEPSRTAYRVALRRAAHQLIDRPPVFVDPLALRIITPEDAAAIHADPAAFETTRISTPLRAFVAARAMVAAEELARLHAAGVRQYVLLGAGLDTSPYRMAPAMSDLRVWEVDHPSTQAWKRDRLAAGGIDVPPSVTFVPVDFERGDLAKALAGAGFDTSAGAMFAWLGVVPYLTPAAVDHTLRVVEGATRAGGGVVFDYALSRDVLPPRAREVFDAFAARVAAIGEPFESGFAPAALAAELVRMGFTDVRDAAPEAINARWFAGRADELRVGGLAHIMWAGR